MPQFTPPHIKNLPEDHPLRKRFQQPAELTPEEQARQFSAQIDQWLDQVARSLQYRDIVSAVTYIDDSNLKFATEAKALKEWRSAVWTTAAKILVEVQAGKRKPPADWAELQGQLPQPNLA